jgi:hypothetical protein
MMETASNGTQKTMAMIAKLRYIEILMPMVKNIFILIADAVSE